MHNRRLSPSFLIFAAFSLTIITLCLEQVQTDRENESCECFNGGTCSSNDKYIACQCLPGFIGTKCQTQAIQISQNDQQTVINQNYTYFYFEPNQINYYQISLKICLPQNQAKTLTNLVFLEVQRSSGKLKLEPSIYQTSPISFQGKEDRCQTFYTHFIPIRKKLNDQYQRIIFGVAIKNNSDSTANRWVNFLQRTMVNAQQSLKANQIFGADDQSENDSSQEPQVESQRVIISCTYELYLVENYWGTFIIVMSALTLFVSTGVFLYTIRNKYSYTLSNEDILRLYAINPEEFLHGNQQVKNDLSHFRFLMPIMSYQLLVQKEKRAQNKYPKNILKRRIQVNKNETEKSIVLGEEMAQIDKTEKHDVFSDSGSNVLSDESSMSIENTCTICLLNFQKTEKIRQTPCRHIFHSDCIDNWCETTLNCPICRQNLEMPRVVRRNRSRPFNQQRLNQRGGNE